MKKLLFFFICLPIRNACYSQITVNNITLSILVIDEKLQPLELVTAELTKAGSQELIQTTLTNNQGLAVFDNVLPGSYIIKISHTGYQPQNTPIYKLSNAANKNKRINITLHPATSTLKPVDISSFKPFTQHIQGKIIINVDESVGDIGTSILEVLEKSPGIMVDKNGIISLQAKKGVLVMIDDKQTYLSGTELSNLLSSMSSSQVDQIELIPNPSARDDASGNAGIINIKTKKSKLKGFNGSLTTSFGQGHYPKNNNNLTLNYRGGRFNIFLNYSMNMSKYFTDIYAFRRYYSQEDVVISYLKQSTFFSGNNYNNTLKTGIDYYLSDKTTLGLSLTGISSVRKGISNADAIWTSAEGITDSAISTNSSSSNHFRNGAVNVNFRHAMSDQIISVDLDLLGYKINTDQFFTNHLLPEGYTDASQGNVPSTISIFSAKTDYTKFFRNEGKLESGFKTSHIVTDNLATYQYNNGVQWNPDYGKSNHFLYNETIHAIYSSFQQRFKRIIMQGGLRYEFTYYKANQLGNPLRKDSSFSKIYHGLFPSGYITYQPDSSNSFTLSAGRRIDRPPFQKLNPFVFIINKYAHNEGNPFIQPQLSWNIELRHQYKEVLTTTLSFNSIKNYFSQLFLNGTDDILIYTDGNVGRMYNLGFSVATQVKPVKWWSLSGQVLLNYKKLKGYLLSDYTSSVTQLNTNLTNQFRVSKNFFAELSGFYTTKARNDLQELLLPTGQVSAGFTIPVLKNKGSLKFSARDIFYTQVMEGNTQFDSADEYFKLHYDTRVFTVSFTYRFGNPFKISKTTNGGAGDEMQRAGNGNN